MVTVGLLGSFIALIAAVSALYIFKVVVAVPLPKLSRVAEPNATSKSLLLEQVAGAAEGEGELLAPLNRHSSKIN